MSIGKKKDQDPFLLLESRVISVHNSKFVCLFPLNF